MKKRLKTPQAWLAVAFSLIMVGSILANLFNTSFYKVDVTQITFNTDKGKLSGLLYLPKGAGPASPRPTIITTHGYLNAKEMQAAPAIEMSRRGYVVLALDCYAHGDSFLNNVPKGGEFFSYWPSSLYDAVTYMYGQNYVLKDEKGNGMIAVSGHSMGGFSSTMAMAMDEQAYLNDLQEGNAAVRKIHAVLAVGADYLWTSYLGVNAATADQLYANRTVGTIAGQFDEFFFDTGAQAAGKSMVKKNYIATETGKTFLRNPADPKVGVFYPTKEGGQRIIYQPFQTHPWNHISVKTTGHMIDFYTTAFQDYTDITTQRGGQIWLLKELLETLGLIGFFLLFVPIIQLLSGTSLLKHTVSKPIATFSGPKNPGSKGVFWVLVIFSALFPALIYTTFLNKTASGLGALKVIGLIIFILAILAVVFALIRKKEKSALAAIITASGAFILTGLTAGSKNMFLLGPVYNSPITNNVAYWAVAVTTITFIILSIVYQYMHKPSGITLGQYGFMVKWKTLVSALLTAILAAAIGFIILQLVDVFFKTDFRLWLVVVRAFNKQHLATAICYMPFLLLYFLLNGVALQVNTNSDYMKGKRGYLTALLINIGGLVAWLILQYGALFITGKAAFASQSLNSIVLIGLTVNLGIATIITKKCLDKTNNIYTGAFLNTILITVITIASSTMYFSLGA